MAQDEEADEETLLRDPRIARWAARRASHRVNEMQAEDAESRYLHIFRKGSDFSATLQLEKDYNAVITLQFIGFMTWYSFATRFA
jgi:hypothetical protein